jgi:hypothetical protein
VEEWRCINKLTLLLPFAGSRIYFVLSAKR